MNVFEGARRIALLIGFIGSIIAIVAIWVDDRTPTLKYRIDGPGRVPVHESQDFSCPSDAASGYIGRYENRSLPADIVLCFPSVKSDNGLALIPYAEDGQEWLVNYKHSSEVLEYTQAFEDKFVVPAHDVDWLGQQVWPIRFAKAKELFYWLAGGWFALWILTKAIGWIVRGFAGIPSGADKRPAR